MKTTNTSDLSNQDFLRDSFNSGFTAIPKGAATADEAAQDPDLIATEVDYGEMNTEDAILSGYVEVRTYKFTDQGRDPGKGSRSAKLKRKVSRTGMFAKPLTLGTSLLGSAIVGSAIYFLARRFLQNQRQATGLTKPMDSSTPW